MMAEAEIHVDADRSVRMLLKPGYKGVYVSRSFAIKAQLVDRKVRISSILSLEPGCDVR